jgi:hypothetical protein
MWPREAMRKLTTPSTLSVGTTTPVWSIFIAGDRVNPIFEDRMDGLELMFNWAVVGRRDVVSGK